jgi:hypothetical protein
MLVAVFATVWLSADARAAGSAGSERPFLPPAFRLPATNGYSAIVYGVAGKHHRGSSVTIVVYDRHSVSSYTADGRVRGGRMVADFGDFGTVDIRFHRSGARRLKDGCGGGPRPFVSGRFMGEVRFRFEGAYTQVRSTTVNAPPLYRPPNACEGVSIVKGGRTGALLRVYSRFGQIDVVQNRPHGRASVIATTETRHEGVEIEKTLELGASPSAFRWSTDMKHATLTPPPPFSGTATYAAFGGRVTHWEGNLRVEYPGWSQIPLTRGPSLTEFEHGSCRVSGLRPGDLPGACAL